MTSIIIDFQFDSCIPNGIPIGKASVESYYHYAEWLHKYSDKIFMRDFKTKDS